MHTRYVQVGGIAEDLPPGFVAEARKFCAQMPKSVDEYEAILDRNAIWLERTKGVGLLSADDALALAQSGPMLRSTGVDWDLRRNTPYLAYDEVEFDVPVYGGGDVYDRYRVHMSSGSRRSPVAAHSTCRRLPTRAESRSGGPSPPTPTRRIRNR